MSILQIFFVIIAVLTISIICIVLNIIYHAKIIARINNLEKDIEKKTLEFDVLKRERTTGQSIAHQESPLDNHTHVFELPVSQEEPQPIEESVFEEGSIQIVRNVGGTFQTTDAIIHGHGHQPTPTEPDNAPSRPKPNLTPVPPPRVLRPAPPPAGTVIPLYSSAAKGPDFNRLYQSLLEAMKKSADPAIAFDFSGVESLNDGELEYLEKTNLSLVNSRRTLTFVHCSENMAALIRRRRPSIASHIR